MCYCEPKQPEYIKTQATGYKQDKQELNQDRTRAQTLKETKKQEPKHELPRSSPQIQDANQSQPVTNQDLSKTQPEPN